MKECVCVVHGLLLHCLDDVSLQQYHWWQPKSQTMSSGYGTVLSRRMLEPLCEF